MHSPRFWRTPSLLSTVLLPLASLYRMAYISKVASIEPTRLPIPVICVGNATVGGAGKTPTVIALMDYFNAKHIRAHCLSRGYKGSLQGPVLVDPAKHTHEEVGDEPLLLARHGPCWVAKKRLLAAQAAIHNRAEVLVMDDGLQNPTLEKDLTLMVVDGGYGFGNHRLLPAGPLREPLEMSMAKSDAIIMIGADKTGALSWNTYDLPVGSMTMKPQGANPELKRKPIVAFAGIGRPSKFYSWLKAEGYHVVATRDFPDHHAYTTTDVVLLKKLAQESGNATLVTTTKDAVRLPESFRKQVEVIKVGLAYDKQFWDDLLAPICERILNP